MHNAERSKGSKISLMLAKYNREMADLEEALRVFLVRSSLSSHPLTVRKISLGLWAISIPSTESEMEILSVP